jgi:hypothetical protein
MFMFLRFIAGALSLALLVSLAGCRRDPHITTFTVVPQQACPGEVVTATWTTTSDFVRLGTSSGSGMGPAGANSSFGVTVTGDTVFTLSAHIDDRSITESRRVTVRSPLEFPEVISVVCEGSTPRFRTIIYEPAQYSSRFKAASIRNRSMQPVTVEHLTIHRTLAPGEEVTERDFGTVDFIGEWRITTAVPVNACQQPGTGGGPPPPQLPPPSQVTLVATCR